MKIETERLVYMELEQSDFSRLSVIAEKMAWNDTVNLLLRPHFDSKVHEDENKFLSLLKKRHPKLFKERQAFIKRAEQIVGKSHKDMTSKDRRIVYEKTVCSPGISQDSWHINFSLLEPPFSKNAIKFIQQAQGKKLYGEQKDHKRNGFWLGIKDKESGELIGVTMISGKCLTKEDSKIAIGHSGQFIHPDFQRKGFISETKAVMVDMLYKLSDSQLIEPLPENAYFYTTCDELNIASQQLQEKSGAVHSGIIESGKMHFFATREQIENSRLMQSQKERKLAYMVTIDNGIRFKTQVGAECHINFIDKNKIKDSQKSDLTI